jgi:hypothetical protein
MAIYHISINDLSYFNTFNWSFNPVIILSNTVIFFRIRYLVFNKELIYIIESILKKVFKLWQLTSFLKVFICFNDCFGFCVQDSSAYPVLQQNYSNPCSKRKISLCKLSFKSKAIEIEAPQAVLPNQFLK